MSSSANQACPVCSRAFGVMLWKHSCDVCRRTVCDDCAPRNVDSVGPDGASTKLRVCKTCGSAGRRLSSGPPANATSAPRVDPNSEEERLRRMAAIEARNKSQQSRGRPQSSGTPAAPRPSASVTPPAASPAAATPTPPATAEPQAVVHEEAAPPTASSAGAAPSRPTNPALEAALRRQQQQQARSGASPAATMSPEKIKLLREIDALLATHREEPPFGLRASDEVKLKGYLQYLKSKYHIADS